MAKLTTAEFIEAIKELTVLELNDLVKACEEEFGVSAAAGVVVAAAGAAAPAALHRAGGPVPGRCRSGADRPTAPRSNGRRPGSRAGGHRRSPGSAPPPPRPDRDRRPRIPGCARRIPPPWAGSAQR